MCKVTEKLTNEGYKKLKCKGAISFRREVNNGDINIIVYELKTDNRFMYTITFKLHSDNGIVLVEYPSIDTVDLVEKIDTIIDKVSASYKKLTKF